MFDFSAFIGSEIDAINAYRTDEIRRTGQILSFNDAAIVWIAKYAESFKQTYLRTNIVGGADGKSELSTTAGITESGDVGHGAPCDPA